MSNVWHIRFGVTSKCNFRCVYCNPQGLSECRDELSTEEVLEIAYAAYLCGIKRIHWTGGEPTLRFDFLDLVKGVKEMGYKEQIVTTNGYRLGAIMEEAIASGLTRVIVSLDTLSEERNLFLTGSNHLSQTITTLSEGIRLFPTVTKMNVATLRSTLPELPSMVQFIHELNLRPGVVGRGILKLIEFCPSNPAQLTPEGQKLYREEWVSEKEIMDCLSAIGQLEIVTEVGDNPSCRYYRLIDQDVVIGVLAMPSWGNPCGRCHKLRITPLGKCSVCLCEPEMPVLKGKKLDEKVEIIQSLIAYRQNLDSLNLDRKHFRDQLGEMRFGKIGIPVSATSFDRMRKR